MGRQAMAATALTPACVSRSGASSEGPVRCKVSLQATCETAATCRTSKEQRARVYFVDNDEAFLGKHCEARNVSAARRRAAERVLQCGRAESVGPTC